MAPVHFGLPLLDLSLLARAVKRGRLAIASPLESAPRKSSIPPGSRNGAFFDAHPQAAWRQRLLSFTRITTTIVDFLPVSQRKYYRRQRGDNAGTTSVVKNWMQKLGEDIARARRKVSMTQEELRLATGLSRNTIGHYERGERAPDFGVLRRIAAAVSADQFEVDNDIRIVFTPNGKRPESSNHPQQLTLNFDDSGALTLRIEAAKAGLLIKAASA